MHMQGGKRSCAALEAARGWRRVVCQPAGREILSGCNYAIILPFPRESGLKLLLGPPQLLKYVTPLAKV